MRKILPSGPVPNGSYTIRLGTSISATHYEPLDPSASVLVITSTCIVVVVVVIFIVVGTPDSSQCSTLDRRNRFKKA